MVRNAVLVGSLAVAAGFVVPSAATAQYYPPPPCAQTAAGCGGTTPAPVNPTPAPPAPTPLPTPPAPTTPTTPLEPTVEQQREARTAAGVLFDTRARRMRGYSLGPFLVFAPRPGGGPRRPNNTPSVRPSGTVTFHRRTLRRNKPQRFLAVSCVTSDCTTLANFEVRYRNRAGRKRTRNLPQGTLTLTPGDTDLIRLQLPGAVRRAVLAGRRVRLIVGIQISTPSGYQAEGQERFKLRAKPRKAQRRGSK